jgi:hypothetical protein
MDGALRQLFLPRLVNVQRLAEIKRIREMHRRSFRSESAQLRNVLLLQELSLWVLDPGNGKDLGRARNT